MEALEPKRSKEFCSRRVPERDDQCGRCIRTSGPDNKKAGTWLRHESKADIGTLQLQLCTLECAPMLRTSPDSLTHIHSNRRGVVVQALIAIPMGTDLPRRHASPKLFAVNRSSTRPQAIVRSMHSLVVLYSSKLASSTTLAPLVMLRALASLSSNRFASEGALAGRGSSCADMKAAVQLSLGLGVMG